MGFSFCFWRTLLLAAAVACLQSPGLAQSYPDRPVKIIVGYVPGGGPDFVARTFAQKLGEILRQPFVVENRPGAGATIATAFVAKAPADGYTLLLGETGQLFIAPYVYRTLPYKTASDFTPISMVASGPLILVASSSVAAETPQDVINEAKARPGKISVGTSGIGTIHHLALEVLKAESGADLMHVPYKGSGQSVTGILANEVPLLITSLTAGAPHVAAGKIKVVAVTSAIRVPSLPNVPAIAELLKDYDYSSEMGFLAPSGLPVDILVKLSSAMKQAAESPEVLQAFKRNSTIIRYTTPEEYAANIRRNLVKYERAVKIASIPTQ